MRNVKCQFFICFSAMISIIYKPKNKINLLNIGRFESQKDHFTLLKAIKYSGIKDKINLVLVGYGKNYQKIKNYVKKNKINVKIFIKDEKLDKYYKKKIFL